MAKAKRICSVDGCSKPHYGHGWCDAHYRRWKRHGDPLGGRTPAGELTRFIHEVALAYEGEECLIWPFGRSVDGRGKVHIEGKNYGVHRIVCELAHGPPPSLEHEAAHSCGNGHLGCVSLNHLSWKTRAENQADRLIHGTESRGSRHGLSKLTDSDVLRIRALRGQMSQREISEMFGVSRSHIANIHIGKVWNWLRLTP